MDIMLDIETLGTAPGSVVFAIGAVAFDAGGPGRADDLGDEPRAPADKYFYTLVAPALARARYGLIQDDSTMEWWARQSATARKELIQAGETGLDLADALTSLTRFMGANQAKYVWGKGPSFDCSLLSACYRAVGLPVPWKFWNERCVRTVYAMADRDTFAWSNPEVAHHALHDAMAQADNVSRILRGVATVRK